MSTNIPRLKPTQLKETAKRLLLNGISTIIWGPPGIGKTELSKQIAEEIGTGHYVIDAISYLPSDLVTCIPDKEKSTLTEYTIDIPTDTILIIDDISLCEEYQIKSFMKVIYEKRLGNKRFKYPCILTANRTSDNTGARNLIDAFSNRIAHLELTINNEDWIQWGTSNGISNDILSFIKVYPDKLYNRDGIAFSTPRTWNLVNKFLNSLTPEGNDELFISGIGSLIGLETANQLLCFTKYFKDFDPEECIRRGKIDSADGIELYAKIMALGTHLQKTGIKHEYTKGLESIFLNLEGDYKGTFIGSLIRYNNGEKDISILLELNKVTTFKDYIKNTISFMKEGEKK